MNGSRLSRWARLSREIRQSIFDQIDNYRSQQACCDLQRAQSKSRFDKFAPGSAVAFFIDVNFFPSERQKNDKRADSRRGCKPSHRLLLKRSAEFCRKIQFVVQTPQIMRHACARTVDLCSQLVG